MNTTPRSLYSSLLSIRPLFSTISSDAIPRSVFCCDVVFSNSLSDSSEEVEEEVEVEVEEEEEEEEGMCGRGVEEEGGEGAAEGRGEEVKGTEEGGEE